ncbi:MAG: HypC/HybG/HupF family hydrogenase formation chaperone [Bacteroidales bacterium]
MCLSIPARIEVIEGEYAVVSFGGNSYRAGLHLLENVKAGDYVLLHAGFAIQKIDLQEAEETLRLIDEMQDPPDGAGGG